MHLGGVGQQFDGLHHGGRVDAIASLRGSEEPCADLRRGGNVVQDGLRWHPARRYRRRELGHVAFVDAVTKLLQMRPVADRSFL